MEEITEIPAHIKALPEAEQGPALVEAIHQRKQLAQAWEYYSSIPAPTYDPFKATRQILAGARGHGKNRMQAEWLRKEAARAEYDRQREDALYLKYGRSWAKSITWSCPRLTAPVYPVGSNGWLAAQHDMRMAAHISSTVTPPDSRMMAKVYAIQDLMRSTEGAQ